MAGFRPNLTGKVHPDVERYIRSLQDELERLQGLIEKRPAVSTNVVKTAGSGGGALIGGVFAQPDLATGSTDPSLEGLSTQDGTVTSVGITAGTGIGVAGSPITTSGNITVSVTNAVVRSTAAKVTAAAPYANDGYIEMTVNGVLTKIMTTA